MQRRQLTHAITFYNHENKRILTYGRKAEVGGVTLFPSAWLVSYLLEKINK